MQLYVCDVEGAIAGNLSKQHFDLTMRQAEAVEWCIERNEFGLDFALAFPDDMHRVIVADPAITVIKLKRGGIFAIVNFMEKWQR